MRTFVVASALLALAGCASEAPGMASVSAPTVLVGENETLTPQTKLICHREAEAGTVFVRTICETEKSALDRIALQERLRNMAKPSSNPHPGM